MSMEFLNYQTLIEQISFAKKKTWNRVKCFNASVEIYKDRDWEHAKTIYKEPN